MIVPGECDGDNYMSEIKTSRDSGLVITTGYNNCRLWRETESGDSLTPLLCLEEEHHLEFFHQSQWRVLGSCGGGEVTVRDVTTRQCITRLSPTTPSLSDSLENR